MADAEVVYHAAGAVDSYGPWDHFYKMNVEGG